MTETPVIRYRTTLERPDENAHLVAAVFAELAEQDVPDFRYEVLRLVEGLPEAFVINSDNLVTIPKSLIDDDPVGRLGPEKRIALDIALRFSLDIQF